MARYKQRSLPQRLALGAVAGVAATFVMQGMMTASGKLIPGSRPPIKQDPGEFMAGKVPLPEAVRPWAAKSLQLGYGMTPGVLYGALRARRGSPVFDGALPCITNVAATPATAPSASRCGRERCLKRAMTYTRRASRSQHAPHVKRLSLDLVLAVVV